MKKLKVIAINILVLVVVLFFIDPLFKSQIGDNTKISRKLELREYGPNRYVELNPFGHVPDTSKLDRNYYLIETDDYGFICGPNENKETFPEIVFFGGSTVECAFVDDSLRYPYLVGQSLNRVTRNSGYGGNHSFHSLINLLGTSIDSKPDVIVLMHNINDLTLLSRTGSYFTAPGNRDILNEEIVKYQPSFNERLGRFKLSTINLLIPNIYKRLSKFKKQYQEPVDEWDGYRDSSHIDSDRIVKAFAASLSSFTEVAQAHGIKIILMTQFNRIIKTDTAVVNDYISKKQPLPFDVYAELYRSFNQEIRNRAAHKNIPLIDLDSAFFKKPDLFYDAVHLNNAGSIYASELIAPIVDSISKSD